MKIKDMKLSFILLLLICFSPLLSADDIKLDPQYLSRLYSWIDSLEKYQEQYESSTEPDNYRKMSIIRNRIENQNPILWDWLLQDLGPDFSSLLDKNKSAQTMINMVLKTNQNISTAELDNSNQKQLFRIYLQNCINRRQKRLGDLLEKYKQLVFARHYNMGGSHYAYTEGLSDAQAERHFQPGTALCILEMETIFPRTLTLISDRSGVIRNPDVSFDGQRILFSWKKADRTDDYHLYEMDIENHETRQLTVGLGFADYEGCYLPNGDILFNSTRCVQTVDCWWTEVSNLYTCDADGKFLRRLSFDQVHTNFPTILEDGRIIYTRWDYNDRGQIYPQSLFQMYPDGTGQTEFYGNNSWFPTTLIHARGIPGTGKIAAIATGHHSLQTGKLCIIDPSKGRQEAQGVQLIAPVRKTEAVRIDHYGQQGDLFQYPYPIDENSYIVCYFPDLGEGREYTGEKFKIYYMTADGIRELLVADKDTSCNQPIPIAARKSTYARPSTVDYTKSTGTYFIQDIYKGPGLKGIKRGTVKKLRVIEIRYRPVGIGQNGNGGPAGGALASTPVSIDNGCWDVKAILGDADVYPDGSACFNVPARTPVYFQAIDENGHAIQTMRSWTTLQPNETFSCIGCHESRNDAPPADKTTSRAFTVGPQELKPFYGPTRGFSFIKEIQPILDKHCIKCHDDKMHMVDSDLKKIFSLLGKTAVDTKAKRKWSESYLSLTNKGTPNKNVFWHNVQSGPPMLDPYSAGAAKSNLMVMLDNGHADTKLNLEEKHKFAAWIDMLIPYCGDYLEANAWSQNEIEMYNRFVEKRKKMDQVEQENIRLFINAQSGKNFHPMNGSSAVTEVIKEGQTAYSMKCVFKENNIERAGWDIDYELDLSLDRGIQFSFLCNNLSPVSHWSVYFHSGNGWYAANFNPEESTSWKTIKILKQDTKIEGKPSGWNNIDRIRISAWKGSESNTEFFMRGIRPFGSQSDIIILRNDSAAYKNPSEANAIRLYTSTMCFLLDKLGLNYTVVSDNDFKADRIKGRIAILPYNPSMPDDSIAEVVNFLESGKKIIACYMLDRRLEKFVNIHITQHIKEKQKGYFANIKPSQTTISGLPPNTRQNSWNINQALALNNSRVAAYWYSDDMTGTKLPAIIAADNCIFFSHVITAEYPQDKQQMLLAMLGHLSSSFWQQAANRAIANIGRFGQYKSYIDAAEVIKEISSTNQEALNTLMKSMDFRGRAIKALDEGRYAESVNKSADAHKAMVEAYCLAQKPLNGEHRAFWCHSAFGVGTEGWDKSIKALADNGFTAILPNLLWGAAAYYPSDILPVSPTVKTRGDQLKQCLDACRKYGIECHVWKVNFNMGWSAPDDFMKEMKLTERIQKSIDGKFENMWLCPSHPANKKLEIDSMLEIVEKYDVDGIHFDYIRYPGKDYCFCDGCRRRFEQAYEQAVSDWPRAVIYEEDLGKKWNRFRQDQITEVVSSVSAKARKIKPGIKISAAVFRNWPVDRFGVGQDWKLWCEKGYLDFICPMDYTSSNSQFERMITQQLEYCGSVPCYPGIGLSTWEDQSVVKVIDQVNTTRKLNTGGFTIFNYSLSEYKEILPLLGKGITKQEQK